MKYLKMLGLAAVAAAAMTAILGAGTASATVLCETTVTSGCGTAWHVNSGTNLKFTAEGSTTLTGPFGEVIATCTESTVEGSTSNTGSSSTTVSGNISSLTFTNCGTRTVTVIKNGSLEIHHKTGTHDGTVTSTGTTVLIHGIPIFGTCAFETKNTDIGTLTGSTTKEPTFDISAIIPDEGECVDGIWEGSYEYTGTTTFAVSAS